jgi:heme/copper-type cytochrome/quinol oxidase subunit 2
VLLIVWIVVPVLALLVLGVLGYGVFGAARRLDRELQALEGEVRPVLVEVQSTAEKAAAQRADRSGTDD